MNINETSTEPTPAKHALALAATLGHAAEITLGPTDQEMCVVALRAYAAQLDAALEAQTCGPREERESFSRKYKRLDEGDSNTPDNPLITDHY